MAKAETSDIKSASGQIDLLAPAPFGLSAQPIYVARIPAAPFAVSASGRTGHGEANIAASAVFNFSFLLPNCAPCFSVVRFLTGFVLFTSLLCDRFITGDGVFLSDGICRASAFFIDCCC